MKTLFNRFASLAAVGVFAIAGYFTAGCNSDGTVSQDVIKGLDGFGSIGQGLSSGLKVHSAFHKANEKFGAIDEYHLGRATAAQLIAEYGLYNDEAATRYLNQVGQTLAEFSNKPETYSGYHFAILNSDDVNAFAAPGAFILVTRGLLRCAENEGELAAVLAHELGHIQREHALLAIQKSRNEKFLAVVGTEAAKTAAGDQRAEVGNILDGMSDDVLAQLKNGYSKTQEAEADGDAVIILRSAGYDPNSMIGLLQKMESQLKPGHADFSSTHPKTADRIASIRSKITEAPQALNPSRTARFNTAMAAARGK